MAVFLLVSCTALHNQPSVEGSEQSEVTGDYRLLLFGCRHPDDVLNLAILDREGDPYTIEIHAPDFEYDIKASIPAEAALRQAEQFLQCSFHYQQAELRKIILPDGSVIGYEMRPLYSALRFGQRDVLQISYQAKANRIVTYITLDPSVEEIIEDRTEERGNSK